MHWDYYNSLVIHPMFLACLAVVGEDEQWRLFAAEQTRRAARYAVVQERLVAPDGSSRWRVVFLYRAGAFQTLATVALPVSCSRSYLLRRCEVF